MAISFPRGTPFDPGLPTAPDFEGIGRAIALRLASEGARVAVCARREAVLARRLESRYTKEEILALYLNHIFLGNGAYGVQAAARRYFDRDVWQLDVGELATIAGLSLFLSPTHATQILHLHRNWSLLAGLVQAPSADNPVAHFTVARAREAHVLRRLVATGTLTQAQAARAYRAPLHLVDGPGAGCAAR